MFLALGHLTVTDELLMRSTSGLSDNARRGVADENNIKYIFRSHCYFDISSGYCMLSCGNRSNCLTEIKVITLILLSW